MHTRYIHFYSQNHAWPPSSSVDSVQMQQSYAGRGLPIRRAGSFVKAWSLEVKHDVEVRRLNTAKQLDDIHRMGLEIHEHRLQR